MRDDYSNKGYILFNFLKSWKLVSLILLLLISFAPYCFDNWIAPLN